MPLFLSERFKCLVISYTFKSSNLKTQKLVITVWCSSFPYFFFLHSVLYWKQQKNLTFVKRRRVWGREKCRVFGQVERCEQSRRKSHWLFENRYSPSSLGQVFGLVLWGTFTSVIGSIKEPSITINRKNQDCLEWKQISSGQVQIDPF